MCLLHDPQFLALLFCFPRSWPIQSVQSDTLKSLRRLSSSLTSVRFNPSHQPHALSVVNIKEKRRRRRKLGLCLNTPSGCQWAQGSLGGESSSPHSPDISQAHLQPVATTHLLCSYLPIQEVLPPCAMFLTLAQAPSLAPLACI